MKRMITLLMGACLLLKTNAQVVLTEMHAVLKNGKQEHFSLLDYKSSAVPANVSSFTGTLSNGRAVLQWQLENNEQAKLIEVQRSTNNSDFRPVGYVFTTEFKGTEAYAFKEAFTASPVVYYRLKITDYANVVTYSKMIRLQRAAEAKDNISY